MKELKNWPPEVPWEGRTLRKALQEKGYINNFREALYQIYREGVVQPMLNGYKITPVEAVQLIKKAGGIPVLAHPLTSENFGTV